MNEPLVYHGIEMRKDESGGCLRFGMLRLFQVLTQQSQWDSRWIDWKCHHGIKKYQDTIFKFDRVANQLGDAIKNLPIADYSDEEAFHSHLEATYDIPILLDSLLTYLRIQVDCIANVLPNFYGQRGRAANMPRDSFRKQSRWFLEKVTEFDKEYSSILAEELEWFNVLSGSSRGQGLREIVTHYRGTYQLGWSIEDVGEAKPTAAMVNESGFVTENLIPVLAKMQYEYFRFLDATFSHFIKQLRDTAGKSFWPAYSRDPDAGTQLYAFDEPRARWLYPVAEFRNAP